MDLRIAHGAQQGADYDDLLRVAQAAEAARYASEFNVPFSDVDAAAEQFERVDAACTAIGRDPAGMVRSVAQIVCVGRDEVEIAARARTLGREVDEPRTGGLTGTPAEVVDRIGTWREKAGVTRLYLQLLDLNDLDQVDLIAAQIAPQI